MLTYCFNCLLFPGTKFGDQLYQYDPVSNRWIPVVITGTPPPPCCGAAVNVYGKYIYVFGGYTKQGHTNFLFILIIERYFC
jgi:N-acetylneuraminic acid mutarotase